MEQQDSINLLLLMQEHPEDYTDEQIAKIFAEYPELPEMMEQLSLVKRAIIKQEAENEPLPLDDLWKQFSTAHAMEFERYDNNIPKKLNSFRGLSSLTQKIAAVFIGILITAGIAFAAFHVVRNIRGNQQKESGEKAFLQKPHNNKKTKIIKSQIPDKEKSSSLRQQNVFSKTDTIKIDSVQDSKTTVFDNVTLEKMILEIAAHYNMEMEFKSDEHRQLRFYFVCNWNDSLEQVINRLDRFESIDVKMNDNIITVK